MKRFLLLSLFLLLLTPSKLSAQLFFALDYPKLVQNTANAQYSTQSIDIGIAKYFFGHPVITRSDILPVLSYTRTTYY